MPILEELVKKDRNESGKINLEDLKDMLKLYSIELTNADERIILTKIENQY